MVLRRHARRTRESFAITVDEVNEPLTLTPEERVHSLLMLYTQINTKEMSIPLFYEHLTSPFYQRDEVQQSSVQLQRQQV